MARSIQALLDVSEKNRRVPWLCEALQNAVQLEWTTIPPYLTAMWSIVDSLNDEVAESLKTIVMQEMLHMGLVCNMLTSLGGTPRIADPAISPKYPGELPGNVHVGLQIPLQRISKMLVQRTFMVIEEPDERELRWDFGRSYKTIGAFYTAISNAIDRLPESSFTGERQRIVTHNMTLSPVLTKADALNAVKKIKEQGEGTGGSPMAGGSLAHYFRFGEMYHECRYIQINNKWDYVGDALPMPTVERGEVRPMAHVPKGGYPGISDEFDRAYTQVLRDMEAGWATKDDVKGLELVNQAIKTMGMVLPSLAEQLMTKPIRTGSPDTYGPSFRYLT